MISAKATGVNIYLTSWFITPGSGNSLLTNLVGDFGLGLVIPVPFCSILILSDIQSFIIIVELSRIENLVLSRGARFLAFLVVCLRRAHVPGSASYSGSDFERCSNGGNGFYPLKVRMCLML